VRRCFLCGSDPHTGQNYEHRRQWIQDRLEFLAGGFAIDVLGFAVQSNHFHVILRNRPDVVAEWSDTEVATRWCRLCPTRRKDDGSPEEPLAAELDSIRNHPERLRQIRLRLSDLSWFMRMVSEPVARRANAEDQCSGRFWQGRFRAIKLCDEAALLACRLYVDLNPIRAGECVTPETSRYTSAKLRIDELQSGIPAASQPSLDVSGPAMAASAATRSSADWLAPLPLDETAAPGPAVSGTGHRASDKGYLPMSVEDYLLLLDWTGRQLVPGKSGKIPARLEPILSRLGLTSSGVLKLASGFGELFRRLAGSDARLRHEAARRARRWYQAPGRRWLGQAVGG
jgi:hypothetical protein